MKASSQKNDPQENRKSRRKYIQTVLDEQGKRRLQQQTGERRQADVGQIAQFSRLRTERKSQTEVKTHDTGQKMQNQNRQQQLLESEIVPARKT